MRGLRRILGCLAIVLGAGLLLGAPASAQTAGPCSATIDYYDVRNYSTPSSAKQVEEGQTIRIAARAPVPPTSELFYRVDLELAGRSWTIERGQSTGNLWSTNVNVDTYRDHAVGIFKVNAYTTFRDGPECYGIAYVEIEGDGALSTTAGQAAAGGAVLAAGGLAVSGGNAGKEVPLEGEFAGARDDAARSTEHWQRPVVACSTTLVVAAAATLLALASDAGHRALAAVGGFAMAPQPRRIRFRPLFSIVGMASGVVLALSLVVLLHQSGEIYPTRAVVLIAAAVGLLGGILLPSLMRLWAVRRHNARVAR